VTPANRLLLYRVANDLKSAADQDVDASTGLFVLLDAFNRLNRAATDFHMRPDVNRTDNPRKT
jgi:hypothetical protein